MSFRNRLTLFFVLIVVIPMMSVAIMVFRLIDDNEAADTGYANGVVDAGTRVVANLYARATVRADRVAEGVADDARFGAALRAGDLEQARERAEELAVGKPIARIVLVDDGEVVIDVGHEDAVAVAGNELQGALGRLEVSVTRAAGFTRRVKELGLAPPEGPAPRVDLDLVVRADDRLLHSSLEEVGEAPLPELGTVKGRAGETRRVVTSDALSGFGGEHIFLSVLADIEPSGANQSRLLTAGILLGFFALALAFALAVSRRLQQHIAGLLEAVRRLGRGDFSTRAPTEGRDEFSALGEEFNKMSDQLAARLEELGRERERVLEVMRRLGEAVSSNLDRGRLLKLVVTTAVEGVGAHGGRVSIRPAGDGPMDAPMEEAAGSLDGLEEITHEVEERAQRSGAFAEVASHGVSALAQPLMKVEEAHRRIHGVISVARAGAPFSDQDREFLQYLARQAAVFLENIELHETVAREAVTDGLTGLSNRRRFDEVVHLGGERWRRARNTVSLVMLDIDNFKAVNTEWGLKGGDEVLREVGRVLRESSRENDVPARYGGEELAVVLPDTELNGAYDLAERVRKKIERLEAAVDGKGPVRVTVSAGVSSLPECARDEVSLAATADAALLKAKREGKNRTVCAPRSS